MTSNDEKSLGHLSIREIRVPQHEAEAAHSHLATVGHEGVEGVALWAGIVDGQTFHVHATIIPAQKAFRTSTGLCYTVDASELHRINVWLFENGMALIAQLHSHPGVAFHSELDDDLPIVTTVGSISIVVPDFAREPFSIRNCAVYRLRPRMGWVGLSSDEATSLIHIVDPDGNELHSNDGDGDNDGGGRRDLWAWLTFLTKRR